MRIQKTIFLLTVAILTACGDTENEFTTSRCYFTFDNTSSRSTVLATAMNPLSPGIFCCISANGKYFTFESNQSSGTAERVVYDAIYDRTTVELGVYNESGIIVGYSNLNTSDGLYAFDRQCPNCYKEDNMPRHKLSLTSLGKAVCSSCGREYDLNNRGIVSNGDAGSKLMRYRASSTGPQGILSVNN